MLQSDEIINDICKNFSVVGSTLRGKRRTRTISLVRAIAVYILRKQTTLSLTEIAGEVGFSNHGSCLAAIKKVDDMLEANRYNQKIYSDYIKSRLKQAETD